MIDMYRDGPITAQIYTGQEPLEQEFPLFDDATKDPLSYRLFLAPRSFRRQFPTPQMITVGGMRDRLFFSHNRRRNALITYAFNQLGAARNPNPTGVTLVGEKLLRTVLKSPRNTLPELNMTKIGLIKWKKGSFFSGGAHAVSKFYKVSDQTAAFLHFPFTKGDKESNM